MIKKINVENHRQIGKGYYYESHLLINNKTGMEIPCPDWEWADIDGKRIVWADKGLIYEGFVKKNGLETVKPLYDCNKLNFEELAAPY
jgi:hypothetical protein